MSTNAPVPAERTVCVKCVKDGMLRRVMDAIQQQTRVTSVGYALDQNPLYAGRYLVFANYATAREATNACHRFQLHVNDTWPLEELVVKIKPEMGNHRNYSTPTGTYFTPTGTCFVLFVTNTPTGTTPADLEPVFNEFGPLNEGCPIKKIKEQEAFFVNFMTPAGAEKALQAS